MLNCAWTDEEMSTRLPATLRRAIAQRNIAFYAIDAQAIAARFGLGVRVNMIMETVYLHLSDLIPFDTAIAQLKQKSPKPTSTKARPT